MCQRREESGHLTVWVQPRASRERVVGVMGDALKVALTAAPEKGRANKALTRLIAKQLALPARAVTITAGAASRKKTLQLQGVSEKQIHAWVDRYRT